MGKVKSIIIYILSVLLAYTCGLFTFVIAVFAAIYDDKKDEKTKRRGRVSYITYAKRVD